MEDYTSIVASKKAMDALQYALVMCAGVGGVRKGISSGGSTRHSSLCTDQYWDEAYSEINGNKYGSPGAHRNG